MTASVSLQHTAAYAWRPVDVSSQFCLPVQPGKPTRRLGQPVRRGGRRALRSLPPSPLAMRAPFENRLHHHPVASKLPPARAASVRCPVPSADRLAAVQSAFGRSQLQWAVYPIRVLVSCGLARHRIHGKGSTSSLAPPVRAGYMNYYVTEALFAAGRPTEAVERIREYWGGEN